MVKECYAVGVPANGFKFVKTVCEYRDVFLKWFLPLWINYKVFAH